MSLEEMAALCQKKNLTITLFHSDLVHLTADTLVSAARQYGAVAFALMDHREDNQDHTLFEDELLASLSVQNFYEDDVQVTVQAGLVTISITNDSPE